MGGAFVAAIIFLVVVYWLKSYMGVNLFATFSLSNYFPFNYLVPEFSIQPPEGGGAVIEESYDDWPTANNWSSLWMREEGRVEKSIASGGMENSRCLIIKSNSSKSWSSSFRKFIQVKPGDVFLFQVAAKLQGERLVSQLGISAMTEDMSVVSWSYSEKMTSSNEEWIRIERELIVPDRASLLRLKLSGRGKGVFFYDNVRLVKEVPRETNHEGNEWRGKP